TGTGYRCRCLPGYEGNPYIANNCTNIDECARPGHGCLHKCADTPGNYTCSCPKNFSGDGKENGTGCTAAESLIIKISISTSATGIFLLIFFTWLYLGLKKRRLVILRERFFRKNGGIMLQQRISGDGCSHDQAKVFTAEELKRATNNYEDSRIIGKGGYGTVYKGVLSDNRIVAIKNDLLDLGSKKKMPMLLDWAIGNQTCDVASKHTDNFLCKGHSECDPSYTSTGYRCRCLPGYEGNPYIANNCTSKDACLDATDISPFAGTGANSWALVVALHNVVEKKKRKYVSICVDNEYKFIPFAFFAFEEFNKDALDTLSRIKSLSISHSNNIKSGTLIFHKVSFCIKKE
nr:wall-associated receptor kinase 2-like [Tanacetum cinerariifolium]